MSLRSALLAAVVLSCLALVGCRTESGDRADHRGPYNSMDRWHCQYCDMEYYSSGTCCGGKPLVMAHVHR